MIALTAEEIAEITGGTLQPGSESAPMVDADVVTDSRRAVPGSLFVALRGARVDGHHYLDAAARGGAVAALVSRVVPDAPLGQILVPDTQTALGDLARAVLARLRARPRPPVVVAITGSVGKTTTKDLLATLSEPLGEVIAPSGSLNNEVGLPLTVLRAGADTAVLILEMGADAPGNLTYLTSIAPPDVAVVLAVGRAHLGGFGSIEAIAAAKSEIVQGMVASGTAILNADDPRVAAMAAVVAGARTVTFGRHESAHVRARDVQVPQGRARFDLQVAGQRLPVHLSLYGEHHVTNALAAAAVAAELGVEPARIAQALESAFARSPHRMDVHRTAGGLTIIDDSYNANPDSMRAALRACRQLAADAGSRAVAVLGPMRELGPDSQAEHAAVGEYVARLGLNHLVAVEGEARAIAAGARAAGMAPADVQTASGVSEAVARLRGYLRSGDVVLVKASNGVQLWRVVQELERTR